MAASWAVVVIELDGVWKGLLVAGGAFAVYTESWLVFILLVSKAVLIHTTGK